MLARVTSFLLVGIDPVVCEVEVDIDDTATQARNPQVVGLADVAVKESLERVKSAVMNSGHAFPVGRVLVNLAPADLKKEGPVYDLPIAVGMLAAMGVVPAGSSGGGARSFVLPGKEMGRQVEAPVSIRSALIAGEVALDGRVRPMRGAIAMAALAKQLGKEAVIVPKENAPEAAVVEGVSVYGVRSLSEVVGLLMGLLDVRPEPSADVAGLLREASASIDFASVRGQEGVKRALTIAAAGGHNLLMLGPPGSGKTMMAKALPGIMPALSPEEALELTRIYSAAGQLLPGQGQGQGQGQGEADAHGTGLVRTRPVRSPHHSASLPALVGGGAIPRPGEISLAHHGILFLDELPEFDRDVLESLRQPLEDHCVTIARAAGSVRFPANLMLIAAMNPTPRGTMPVGEVGKRAMDRYLGKLSGPLLDRIDMHVEAPAVPFTELSRDRADQRGLGTSTQQMRERVLRAREAQRARQGAALNARLSGSALDDATRLDAQSKALLGQAMSELGLSARAYDKMRRVSRSIADIDESREVRLEHVAEAVQYRLLDRML